MKPGLLIPEFIRKAQKIKLVIFDVDGIFTDGRIYIDDDGRETKAFHVHDGQGIKFLHQYGFKIGIISGRKTQSVFHRMQQLGIEHIYLGYQDKLPIYEELLKNLNLTPEETAYMGDDLPDLPLLKRAGLGITVPNAMAPLLENDFFVTQKKGGKGAVREMCEALLKSQQYWQPLLAKFLYL